jgi:hypothetical protein
MLLAGLPHQDALSVLDIVMKRIEASHFKQK